MNGEVLSIPDQDSPARIGYHFRLSGVLIFPLFLTLPQDR